MEKQLQVWAFMSEVIVIVPIVVSIIIVVVFAIRNILSIIKPLKAQNMSIVIISVSIVVCIIIFAGRVVRSRVSILIFGVPLPTRYTCGPKPFIE